MERRKHQGAEGLIIRSAAINYGLRDFIKPRPDNFISSTKRQVFPWEIPAAFHYGVRKLWSHYSAILRTETEEVLL